MPSPARQLTDSSSKPAGDGSQSAGKLHASKIRSKNRDGDARHRTPASDASRAQPSLPDHPARTKVDDGRSPDSRPIPLIAFPANTDQWHKIKALRSQLRGQSRLRYPYGLHLTTFPLSPQRMLTAAETVIVML